MSRSILSKTSILLLSVVLFAPVFAWASVGPAGDWHQNQEPDFTRYWDDRVASPLRAQSRPLFVLAAHESKMLAQVTEPASDKGKAPVDETVPKEFQDETVPNEFEDPFEKEEGFAEDPFEENKQAVPPLHDPWEGFNRAMHTFNDNLYEYILRPVAEPFRDIVPEGFRVGLRNIYDIFLAPSKMVSCLVQGKWKQSGIVLARVLINVPLGFAGMADVAGEEYGLKEVNEDFGQALGYRGVPSGNYLVLPVFGPSSVRDAVGLAVDSVLNPLFWIVPDFVTGAAVSGGRMVNEVSFRIEDIKAFKESAIDPYESIRHFYNGLREKAVKD